MLPRPPRSAGGGLLSEEPRWVAAQRARTAGVGGVEAPAELWRGSGSDRPGHLCLAELGVNFCHFAGLILACHLLVTTSVSSNVFSSLF